MAKEWAIPFYNSKRWKNCRREVLRRDNYTCAYCSGRAEEVHHVVELNPDNIHDDNIALNPDNLMSLCHNCHTKETKGVSDVNKGYIFDDDGFVIPIHSKSGE